MNRKVTTFFICLFVYIISTLTSYKWIQVAHSKDGIWENTNADRGDIIMCFTPVLNTIFGSITWIFVEPKKDANMNNVFKIKK